LTGENPSASNEVNKLRTTAEFFLAEKELCRKELAECREENKSLRNEIVEYRREIVDSLEIRKEAAQRELRLDERNRDLEKERDNLIEEIRELKGKKGSHFKNIKIILKDASE